MDSLESMEPGDGVLQITPMEAPPASPAPVDVQAEILKTLQMMQASLADTNKKLAETQAENEQLRQEMNAQAETIASQPVGDDFPANPRAARSVVIGTRPVQDNPERYRTRGKGIVDPGGLSVNNASPMDSRNR